MTKFLSLIQKLPEGYSKVRYSETMYGVTRTDFNQGKSIKLYAEDVSGTNFISCNFYVGITNGLKPCEMPVEKVLHFLENYESIEN
ncbi:peptide methionine sulfoxide reductase [Rasiella sp. SM2506]|uniref:peptide methionine sulfoxide reductase n=1 Tax=Rasiella sp. SM2506 TaxID=3423914 RepID=UPI003D7B4D3E